MKIKLKDKRTVEIVPFNSSIPASAFLKFINDIIGEDVYIMHNQEFDLAAEEEWKKRQLSALRARNFMGLVAMDGKKVVANLEARRPFQGKLSENIEFGVAVSKDFRGVGLGEIMLRMIIKEAKKQLTPRNMYIRVVADNKPAVNLYKKVGFTKIIGREPKFFKHRGKYLDHITLLYTGE
ncbi:MAG: GNAT family N-acetyltransferase [Candidatus Micrarchaeia archaeon]